MSWNYRIFKREYPDSAQSTVFYELHEVYYNDAKQIVAWSTEPEAGPAETVKELFTALRLMARDAYKCRDDILEYEMEPEGDWDWQDEDVEDYEYEESEPCK